MSWALTLHIVVVTLADFLHPLVNVNQEPFESKYGEAGEGRCCGSVQPKTQSKAAEAVAMSGSGSNATGSSLATTVYEMHLSPPVPVRHARPHPLRCAL